MWKVFGWVLSWVFRGVVIKMVILTAVIALVSVLVPVAVSYIAGFISPTALTSAFSLVPPGVWYFLDAFRIDFGAPMVISAFVSAFLIRRLPVIG